VSQAASSFSAILENMRFRFYTVVALALFLFSGCSGSNKEREGTALPSLDHGLKITTWNLQWYPGQQPGNVPLSDQEIHITEVATILSDLNPDILCVQEIKDPKALQRLADAMPGYALQVVSDFRGVQEVAILSRHNAEISFSEEFAKATATPPRGFAHAAFRFGDQVLAVYTVHLKSNAGGGIEKTTPKREESARQLVAHVEKITKYYDKRKTPCTVVLCGDFNYDPGQSSWKDDDTFRILLDAGFTWTGKGLAREETITWLSDGRYPDAAFDHILVRPAAGEEVGRAETTKTARDVSDHRPLTIMLKMEGEE